MAKMQTKNEYLQTKIDIQIAALKASQKPFVDRKSGELDRIMAAQVARSERLISTLYKTKHLVRKYEGKDYQVYLGFRKANIFEKIAAWFKRDPETGARSYPLTKKYLRKFLGSIRWALQDVNKVMPRHSAMPVNSLQRIVKNLKNNLDRTRGNRLVIDVFVKVKS